MHKLTLYPLGNADCYRIDLANGSKLLFDYANVRNSEDDADRRIDLANALRDDLRASKRSSFDVVTFTHGDDDHVHGASEFFYLEHSPKYQTSERVRIDDLWVPAAIIVEPNLKDDARIIQAEARHRLRNGKGVRIFSRPERLREWFDKEGINIEAQRHLLTDAGQLVPGFDKLKQGVEFFVHSPFALRIGDTLIDRNDCSIVLQATFLTSDSDRRLILGADTTHELWKEIFNITKFHGRLERLEWDIFKLPHHCSYLSLGPERGKDKTEPIPEVRWIFEKASAKRGIIVSTSWPIPTADNDDQPPHRQAANYYREVTSNIDGEFKVTMEHPKPSNPQPLIITIDQWGATVKRIIQSGGATVVSRPAPRAG